MRQLVLPIALLGSVGLCVRVSAQDCPAGGTACTVENALGTIGLYEDSVSDISYRSTTSEVWAIEGPLPGRNNLRTSRITVYKDDLQNGRLSFNASFSEFASGIAEVPSTQPFGGNFYVLTPLTVNGTTLQVL